MSPLRIAQEIWCHALVFYIGSPLKGVLLKIGISWSALNDIVKSGEYIEVNNDDNRVWIYKTLWYSGAYIMAKLIIYSGISQYAAAIIL